MNNYDYIVIGGGLTGLMIAHKLSQETPNILLIEADFQLGGANKKTILKGKDWDNGLRFIPASDVAIKALNQLENQLDLKLIASISESHCETYEASGFKQFVGFGDHAPEFYDQINYFLNNKKIELTLPIYQITELLAEKFQGTVLTKSYVTKISDEKGQITGVTVNGSKTYTANNYIYAGPVHELMHILSDDVMSVRAKAKLKKDQSWLAINLDFYHDQKLVEARNLFLLDGTTNDAIGPCVGLFVNQPEDQDGQYSRWMGFIDKDTAEETENISEVLKKMKRQIKRAFPEAFEAIKSERLFISSPISCGEIKMNSNGTLSKAENLWVASSPVNPFKNILGSLMQAQMTLAALGFGEEIKFGNVLNSENEEQPQLV